VSQTQSEKRRNAAGFAAAGGVMVGAAAGGDALLERDLRQSGKPKVLQAARKKQLGAVHARRAAGKAGVWAVRTAGLPLLAYGGYKMVKPGDGYVRKPHVGRDVVSPVVRNATLERQAEKVGKRELPKDQQGRLIRRKKLSRDLSLASGTMGLAALGLRAPQAAKQIVRRVPGAAKSGRLVRLGEKELKATQASNTLGIAAIGTGSVGSFNYASMQGLEARQQQLRNPSGVKKSDRFLRKYGQNISPSAEEGYKTLKRGRNREAVIATGNAVLGGVVAADAVRRARARSGRLGTAVMGTWAGMQGLQTAYNARNARSLQGRMNKIKAKGVERAAHGELGPDRVVKAEGDFRRRAHATEATVGMGVLAAAASNRVPEAVNAVVQRRQNRQVSRLQRSVDVGRGIGDDGREARLETFSNQKPKKKPAVLNAQGRPMSTSAKDRATPQQRAKGRMATKLEEASGRAQSRSTKPFPTTPWQVDPDTGKKITHQTVKEGRRIKRVLTPAARGVRRRSMVLGAGIPLGLGMAWHGSRSYADDRVGKAIDSKDVDAAAVGGSVGLAAYQAPSFAEWAVRSRREKKQTPQQRARAESWKREYGVQGAQKGDPRWKKAYRNYPKDLPGARTARAMSRMYVGRTGMALSTAAATGGAIGAIKLANRDSVDKALLRMPKVNYARKIGAGLSVRRPRTGGVRLAPTGRWSTFRGSVR